MLLDGHDLNAIIAIGNDAWQYIVLKLSISAHLLGILSHSDVALVDEEWIHLSPESLLLPSVRSWIPHLRREYLGLLILHHALCPGRYALAFSPSQ